MANGKRGTTYSIRMSVDGAGKATAEIVQIGAKGEKAFKKVEIAAGRATKRMRSFSGAITKARAALPAIAALASAGALAFKALHTQVDAAITKLDEIGKTADKVGLTTDALQGLRFAADQMSISSEAVTSGIGQFIKQMGEARAETGTLTTILGKMDKALLEQVKTAGTVEEGFDLVIGAMAAMENSSDKAALAAAAFGRTAGISMANLVREGATSIEEFTEAAKNAGVVIDEFTIREMEELRSTIDAISAETNRDLTEAFANFGDVVLWVTDKTAAFTRGLGFLLDKMNELDDRSSKNLRFELALLQQELDAINDSIEEFPDLAPITDPENDIAVKNLKDQIQAINDILSERNKIVEESRKIREKEALDQATKEAQDRTELETQKEKDKQTKEGIDLQKKLDDVESRRVTRIRDDTVAKKLNAEQTIRLAQAQSRSQEEFEDLAREIDLENQALKLNIVRTSDAGKAWLESARLQQQAVIILKESQAEAKAEEDARNDALKRQAEIMDEVRSASKSLTDQLVDDLVRGGQGWENYAVIVLKSLKDIIIRQIESNALSGAGAGSGGGGGGLFDFDLGQLGDLIVFSGAGGGDVDVRHGGGVVGSGGRSRSGVDMSMFKNAPRMHNGGLAGDERATVLKVDEEVLTRSDPRHRKNGGGGTVIQNFYDLTGALVTSDVMARIEGIESTFDARAVAAVGDSSGRGGTNF